MAIAPAQERRSRGRAVLLALALLPGFYLGIVYLAVATASANTPLWFELVVRLEGVAFLATAGNAAWQLARSRAVALCFSIYGFVVLGVIIQAGVVYANAGRG